MAFDKQLKIFIANALSEDRGDGDHTSLATIPATQQAEAQLLVKDDGIIAGINVALAIFQHIDASLSIKVLKEDGDAVKKGEVVFTVIGNAQHILLAERLVLNTMQRMSGIATTTRKIADSLLSTHTKVLDTRKTTPNLRFLEKLAVKIGGGVNHRFGLYDMILIKDNHVDTAGGIEKALLATKHYLEKLDKHIPVEIEVRNMEELSQVLNFGMIDRILLDNFNTKELQKAILLIDKRFSTEASGNITPENALEYAQTGVDFISMGCITHSVRSLDLSLKIKL